MLLLIHRFKERRHDNKKAPGLVPGAFGGRVPMSMEITPSRLPDAHATALRVYSRAATYAKSVRTIYMSWRGT